MFKRSIQWSLILLASAVFVSCASKKKTDDSLTDGSATQQAPQIDSTAMSFDPQGSDSGRISGLETVFFDYDKAALSSSAKKAIAGNADWMKNNSRVSVQIEGHCDNRGSIEYNLALGERRAQAVKSHMVSLGVATNRLSIISYGKEKPLASGDSEDAHARNRRANFVPVAQMP